MRRTRYRSIVMIMAALGLLVVAAGTAGAAVYATLPQPDEDGAITACYHHRTGKLRLLTDRRPACSTAEAPIEWTASSATEPLTVGVDSFGNHAAGSAAVAIDHPSTGKYIVTFDESVLGQRGTIECGTVATLSRGMSGAFNAQLFDAPPGEIATFPAFTELSRSNQVVVSTRDSAGNLADQSFWLVLFC